jgi:hypothetical protein
MSAAGPAVLMMAAPEAPELRDLLGSERAAELDAALFSEAERWAAEVAPGGVESVDGALTDATARVLAVHPGPLLVIWPVLARLRPEHASAALGDLAAGCELTVGPVIDGGLYLLGLARPLAELATVPDEAWSGPEAMSTALQAAAQAGFELGLLRPERALRHRGDVRAALADPLTPGKIGRILRG